TTRLPTRTPGGHAPTWSWSTATARSATRTDRSKSRRRPVARVLIFRGYRETKLRASRVRRAGGRRPSRSRALLQPLRAAREAFAVIVRPDHVLAVPIEDDERRGAPPTLMARLSKRVRRELSRLDRRGGHRRSSTMGPASLAPPCTPAAQRR